MGFDAAAARKAGYSDEEILAFLGKTIDVEGAKKAGYSPTEIVDWASKQQTAAKPVAESPSIFDRFASRTPFAGLTQVPAAISDIAKSPNPYGSVVQGTGEAVLGALAAQNPVTNYQNQRAAGSNPVYSALASVPFVGPQADVLYQDLTNGRIPELAGDVVTALPQLLGVVAPKSLQVPVTASALKNIAVESVATPLEMASKAVNPVTVGAATYLKTGNPEAAFLSSFSAPTLRGKLMAGAERLRGLNTGISPEDAAIQAATEEQAFKAAQQQVKLIEQADKIKAQAAARAEQAAIRDSVAGAKIESKTLDAVDKTKAQADQAATRASMLGARIESRMLDAVDKARAQADRAATRASMLGAKIESKTLDAVDKTKAQADQAATRASMLGAKIESRVMDAADRARVQASAADLKQSILEARARYDEAQRALKDVDATTRQRARIQMDKEKATIKAAAAEVKLLELNDKAQASGASKTAAPAVNLKEAFQAQPSTAAPVSVPPAPKSVVEKAVSLSNTLKRQGYTPADVEAQLAKSLPTLEPTTAKKLANEPFVAPKVDVEGVASGLADRGFVVRDIADYLINREGMTHSQAIRTARSVLLAKGQMSPAQLSSVRALLGKNLSRIRLEDIQ